MLKQQAHKVLLFKKGLTDHPIGIGVRSFVTWNVNTSSNAVILKNSFDVHREEGAQKNGPGL